MIKIYTDGSCINRQGTGSGKGGWGVVIYDPDSLKPLQYGGSEDKTTSNRMELTAMVVALQKCIEQSYTEVSIYSDSQYVIKGISVWMSGWKSNGWKTKQGQEVKNLDIWKELDTLKSQLKANIRYHHVVGHNGNHGNEEADFIATSMAAGKSLDEVTHVGAELRNYNKTIGKEPGTKRLDGKNETPSEIPEQGPLAVCYLLIQSWPQVIPGENPCDHTNWFTLQKAYDLAVDTLSEKNLMPDVLNNNLSPNEQSS